MFFVFILQDLDFTTVKDMVKFIYSGRLLDIADKSDLLLSAADKYDIKDLKEICCQCLSANLNVDQVNLGCCFYILVLESYLPRLWTSWSCRICTRQRI